MSINEFEICLHFDEGENTATAVSEPRYVTHHAYFNLPKIEWKQEFLVGYDLEADVVHELVHVYTWRVWKVAENLLMTHGQFGSTWNWILEEMHEETTSRIANALVKAKRVSLE